jgi:DNA topoisomerase IA
MSFAQFDDFFEICCEWIGKEVMETVEKAEKVEKIEEVEKVEVRFDRIPEGENWWKEALKEVEKEKELLHV